jgi:hypothetical protein
LTLWETASESVCTSLSLNVVGVLTLNDDMPSE